VVGPLFAVVAFAIANPLPMKVLAHTAALATVTTIGRSFIEPPPWGVSGRHLPGNLMPMPVTLDTP